MLQPESIALGSRTLLPELQRHDSVTIVGMAPKTYGYDVELDLARRAAKRQLRLMENHTVF